MATPFQRMKRRQPTREIARVRKSPKVSLRRAMPSAASEKVPSGSARDRKARRGKRCLEGQPREKRDARIYPLIHDVRWPEWLSRCLPEIQRHGGEGNSYDDSERQNHPQKFCLGSLLVFPKQPNEKSNCNRNRQEHALVWPAIEE